jgi:Flp pilus assembly protein TadB
MTSGITRGPLVGAMSQSRHGRRAKLARMRRTRESLESAAQGPTSPSKWLIPTNLRAHVASHPTEMCSFDQVQGRRCAEVVAVARVWVGVVVVIVVVVALVVVVVVAVAVVAEVVSV